MSSRSSGTFDVGKVLCNSTNERPSLQSDGTIYSRDYKIALSNLFFSPFSQEPDPEEVWEKALIRDETYLVAMLGPSGGNKGYAAITGDNPAQHNVVWWINGKLLPEIVVERGKTYYFRWGLQISHLSCALGHDYSKADHFAQKARDIFGPN